VCKSEFQARVFDMTRKGCAVVKSFESGDSSIVGCEGENTDIVMQCDQLGAPLGLSNRVAIYRICSTITVSKLQSQLTPEFPARKFLCACVIDVYETVTDTTTRSQ